MRHRVSRGHFLDRIFRNLPDRQAIISNPIDKRGISPILEQSADQVGQQVFMAANRGIHPACVPEPCPRHDLCIQVLTHTVQSLEFVVQAIASQFRNDGDRVGIMGGKLGIECLAIVQNFPGTGDIGHIGVGFARKHRVALETFYLGMFDFGIPVSTLDQANWNPLTGLLCQIGQKIHQCGRSFLISLHGQAQPIPPGQRGILQNLAEYVDTHHQAVRFLGIDGEGYLVGHGQLSQFENPGNDNGDRFLMVTVFKPRVQSRQLH